MTQLNTGNIESDRIECKRELNDKFERTVVAFMNSKEGGLIYIGVDDNGEVFGVDSADSIQLAIIDRIKNNVLPATLGLFDIVKETHDGHSVLKVVVSSGAEKPYYLREFGMSPRGCFLRVGSGIQPMTTQMIDRMYAHRNRLTLVNMPSPRQSLTFNQLRYYYETNGLTLGDQFERTLDLVDEDGRYNYAAYMLADDNGVSIKVAKYAGTDKVDLIENEEYGYCCLLKAADRVLEKMIVENKTFAKVTPMKRLERKMIDPTALAEAAINGIIHNDFSQEVPPVVEIYSDRLTITSHGGLIDDLSQEDFFNCISKPRNRVLMRVFKDTGKVEQLGSGMDRILKAYDRSIFNITPSLLIVTFPFAEGYSLPRDTTGVNDNNVIDIVTDKTEKNVSDKKGFLRQTKIIELLISNGALKVNELATLLEVSERTIHRDLDALKSNDKITRIGSDSRGYWQVGKNPMSQ